MPTGLISSASINWRAAGFGSAGATPPAAISPVIVWLTNSAWRTTVRPFQCERAEFRERLLHFGVVPVGLVAFGLLGLDDRADTTQLAGQVPVGQACCSLAEHGGARGAALDPSSRPCCGARLTGSAAGFFGTFGAGLSSVWTPGA